MDSQWCGGEYDCTCVCTWQYFCHHHHHSLINIILIVQGLPQIPHDKSSPRRCLRRHLHSLPVVLFGPLCLHPLLSVHRHLVSFFWTDLLVKLVINYQLVIVIVKLKAWSVWLSSCCCCTTFRETLAAFQKGSLLSDVAWHEFWMSCDCFRFPFWIYSESLKALWKYILELKS